MDLSGKAEDFRAWYEVYEKIGKLHPEIYENCMDLPGRLKGLGLFMRYMKKLVNYIRKICKKPDVKVQKNDIPHK